MKKILFILAFFLTSCASRAVAPLPTVEPIDKFQVNVDESVGCETMHPAQDDIAVQDGNVLEVVANARNVFGLYMNAIAGKQTTFVNDSTYTLTGEWRRPEDAENEQFDVNVQLVDEAIEYHAEILWDQNPENNLYGWVWTRGQDLNEPIKLFQVPVDNNWHKFKIVTEYVSNPKRRVIKSISVDNKTSDINITMGTLPKAWYSSFMVLLETTNKYTNCLPSSSFIGKSEWRNILLTRIDLNPVIE